MKSEMKSTPERQCRKIEGREVCWYKVDVIEVERRGRRGESVHSRATVSVAEATRSCKKSAVEGVVRVSTQGQLFRQPRPLVEVVLNCWC